MELSLDDYIKAKKPAHPKAVNKPGKFNGKPKIAKPAQFTQRPPITDARNKLIQKHRAKIHDVRDVISQKKRPADARYVITKNMSERLKTIGHSYSSRPHHHPLPDPYMMAADLALDDFIPPMKHHHPHHRSPTKPMRYLMDYPDLPALPPPRSRAYVDYDAIEDTKPLDSRGDASYDALFKDYVTVKGGKSSAGGVSSASFHSKPPASSSRMDMDEDIFDLYDAPSRTRRPMPPAAPAVASSHHRRYVPTDDSHLSYEMRSRLEGHTSEPASMGIFANPTKSLSSDKHSQTRGYRVMVTNLHSSVTVWDIQELFGDIGGLVSAVILKPGVAEVIYKTVKDAEDAVEVYHNRQLDGQPMKCHLITPTAPPRVESGSSSSSARRPPLELDLDTLHSALFTNKRR